MNKATCIFTGILTLMLDQIVFLPYFRIWEGWSLFSLNFGTAWGILKIQSAKLIRNSRGLGTNCNPLV